MFLDWFEVDGLFYNKFVKYLLSGNVEDMNRYMNDVALEVFSSFDTGTKLSKKTRPERFYHGFVLGLLVEVREEYRLKSNRESGYGR